MKIYVARHGSTVGNETSIVQGWLGGELSSSGIKQAEGLALEIKKLNPQAIITSDLARATQTAEIINTQDLPILCDWRLRERYFGNLEGKSSNGLNWLDFWTADEDSSYYGQETTTSVYARSKDFVNSLPTIAKFYSNILLLTHGGMINVLKSLELGDSYTPKRYANCELVEINYNNIVNI